MPRTATDAAGAAAAAAAATGPHADFFDGRSARAWPVRVSVEGDVLRIEGVPAGNAAEPGDGAPAARIDRRVPLADVRWPERTRHGARIAHLRDGGSLQALDAAHWDAWVHHAGRRESIVVRAQQSWRLVALTALALLLTAVAGYRWGIPLAARAVLVALPLSADRAVGEVVLRSLDSALLEPSATPVPRQQALRAAFAKARERADPDDECSGCQLEFRTSAKVGKTEQGTAGTARTRIGPNAFALPGGTIVVTDDMLELLKGRDDVLLGVLGHELGHVQRRHGMRMLVQASLLGAAATLAWGDASSLLATAPVLLGQSAYSRDFEREADAKALVLLRANGLSPHVMVELFDRLGEYRRRSKGKDPASAKEGDKAADKDIETLPGADTLGIAFASHPADAERVRFFQEAGR